jgi:predicted nucleic acid-binding Zn ribbon protein
MTPPTHCFACGAAMAEDGFCAEGCMDDEPTTDYDHRHNPGPFCAKCGGACEMDPTDGWEQPLRDPEREADETYGYTHPTRGNIEP